MLDKIKRITAMLICAAVIAGGTGFTGSTALAADTSAQNGANAANEAKNYGTEETDIPSMKYDSDRGIDVFAGVHPNYQSWYGSYQYDLFKDILKLYTETHLYEFTEKELTEAFLMKLMKENPELMKMYINTLLGTMDEYSTYYESGYGLASDGASLGYGISVSDETNYVIEGLGIDIPGIYIVDVIKDSAAESAGIETGDRIISVEDIPVQALTYDGATDLIRKFPYVREEVFDENGVSLGMPEEPEHIVDEATGKKSYYLHMTLAKPDGSEYTVKLLKGKVVASSIGVNIPTDKNYAYIQIASFRGEKLVEDFKSALLKAKAARRDNLIIDLRGNGGGVLEYAVEMANLLIEEKGRILFYTNSRNQENLTVTKSLGGGMTFERITVLVDRNSASASELFAMIMSFHCGAMLVGETTYGKAVGQNSYGFVNGDMFTVTTFEILDPTKKSYNQKGLTPDVEAEPGLRRFAFPEDGLEVFNYINYKELNEGSTGDTVMGLERRLQLMGILREAYVDGVYDVHTTAAINSLKASNNKPLTGLLDDEDVEYITLVINRFKNYYYTYDAELEVAEMSFSSRSQAKRRAKELAKESKLVAEEKARYEAEIMAQIKAEDEAEMKRLEEEERAAEEAAKAAEGSSGSETSETSESSEGSEGFEQQNTAG